MASPGGGAGNEAAAISKLKQVFPILHMALMALPVGGKDYAAVSRAITALAPIVGKTEATQPGAVPPGIIQMAQAGKGGPLAGAPSPSLSPAPPPGGMEEAA